jgi:hypothetical protein
MPRAIPPAVTQRVKDIKDLIDDLVRLRLGGDTDADEMSSRIKLEIDALVRSVRRLPH